MLDEFTTDVARRLGPSGEATCVLPQRYSGSRDKAPTMLYAARGRLIPFNSNSPTGSTLTAFPTFVSTRGLIRICPA